MRNFAIIKSVDAPKHVSPKVLSACTERMISSMPQTGASMPPILVMLVSESVAAVVGVGHTGVIRHNRSSAAELPSYYEVWLVGQAGIADYVLALQGIMNDVHAHSAPSELEIPA
ncbi:MAG TPA: hypothetical protein VGJ51_08105 [Candidatus Angelobacter sp.]|jgi:hypothetical protein